MALSKTIRIGGVPLKYHRIRVLMVDVNNFNTIEVMSYLDADERHREDDVDDPPYRVQWSVETAYDEGMSVKTAYEYLKTLPEFEGAEEA